jgi:hypothetical protein
VKYGEFFGRKERIEKRGPIAKDVTLDVQLFKPQAPRSLFDEVMNRKPGCKRAESLPF